MSEELIWRLQQLRGTAAALQGLMRQAQECAPRQSHGQDGSGAVKVVLDAEGLPVSVTVEPDWQRRLRPASLSTAVMQAFAQAAQVRMRAWTRTLESRRWSQQVHEMTAADAELYAADEVPQLFRRDQGRAGPRDVSDLAEDMIKAFDEVDLSVSASPAQFSGTDRGRHIRIVLSGAGLIGCTVDIRWAAGRSAAALTAAFAEALARAQESLRASAAPAPLTRRLDSLLDETISLLHSPQRPEEP